MYLKKNLKKKQKRKKRSNYRPPPLPPNALVPRFPKKKYKTPITTTIIANRIIIPTKFEIVTRYAASVLKTVTGVVPVVPTVGAVDVIVPTADIVFLDAGEINTVLIALGK